jgi:hypothetical protein
MRGRRVLTTSVAIGMCIGTLSLGAAGSASAAPGTTPRTGAATAFGGGAARWLAAMQASIGRRTADGVVLPAPIGALAAPVPKITLRDPTGDAFLPTGDVTGVGVAQNAAATAFEVTVKAPTNPKTDPIWLAGGGFVFWAVDSNRDGNLDAAALLASDPSGNLIALAGGASGPNPNCNAQGAYVPNVGYKVIAPAGCVGQFTTVRFGACMDFYDPSTVDPDNPPLSDCAPNNGGFSADTNVHQGSGAGGYWMLGADGHVYPFGGAVGFPGHVPGSVAMAPRHDGKGYWIVDRVGHVYSYGSAKFHGGSPPLSGFEFVSTISATPSGNGYWLFTNRGRAFPFGDASSFGDMSGQPLTRPIVASVATPSGHGYYMVGSDGGIFSFGDARFHGSTGAMHLNRPIVGISPTPSGHGYWLVGTDGGVFAFNAPFRGSMGGTKLNRPVDGLVAYGNGYLMAASDGGVFNFSNRAFYGSLGSHPPSVPIVSIAAYG